MWSKTIRKATIIKSYSKLDSDTKGAGLLFRVTKQRARVRVVFHVSIGLIMGLVLGGVLGYVFLTPGSSDQAVKTLERSSDSPPRDEQGYQITLPTRSYYSEERQYNHEDQVLPLKECAIVLIDIWVSTYDTMRFDSHCKQNIVQLLEIARENGITVIHAYHSGEVADDCVPVAGEMIVDSANTRDDCEELKDYLESKNISTLIYAGYATNMCILNRPVGIINMSRVGYNVILLRDCTLAVENEVSREGQWAKEMAVFMVELNWGTTATLGDLRQALESRQATE